jgi:hypothetical protein
MLARKIELQIEEDRRVEKDFISAAKKRFTFLIYSLQTISGCKNACILSLL